MWVLNSKLGRPSCAIVHSMIHSALDQYIVGTATHKPHRLREADSGVGEK